MDELGTLLKSQGPLGAVIVLVLAYFMKVLVPQFQNTIDRMINDFRADTTQQRVDFLNALKEERGTHKDEIIRIETAIMKVIGGPK